MSIDKKAMEMKRMSKSYSLHHFGAPPRAVLDGTAQERGAGEGASDVVTPGEPLETPSVETKTEETKEESPGADVGAESPEVADVEAWDWVSVRATRGLTALQGKHSVEMEVTPVGTKRRRATSSSKSTGSEDRNSLRCTHVVSENVTYAGAACRPRCTPFVRGHEFERR